MSLVGAKLRCTVLPLCAVDNGPIEGRTTGDTQVKVEESTQTLSVIVKLVRAMLVRLPNVSVAPSMSTPSVVSFQT